MTELKSNIEWKQWGKDDPLWGVSPWASKQKGGSSPWTEEDFYALGAADWEDFLVQWKQYGVNTKSCLEIGCGAGRLTKQLSNTFDLVYAVDISEHMINYARKAVGDKNVQFSLTDGLHLPQADNSVKGVFSFGVLQHLDSAEVLYTYFREFYRVLDTDGTLMINVPLYQFPNDQGTLAAIMGGFYAGFRHLDNIRSSIKRGLGMKLMRWTPLEMRPLSFFLYDLGFKNVQFGIFPLRRHSLVHPFIFARK